MVQPIDDLFGISSPRRPLQVAIVRGEVARASLGRIDAAEALRAPGVRGVFAYEDLRRTCAPIPIGVPGLEEARFSPLLALSDGEVRYPGEPVAAVVAETISAAADAAELVRVSCAAPLDVATSGERRAFSSTWSSGDLEAEFRKAEWRGTFRFALPAEVPRPLELSSVVARFDPGAGTLAALSSSRSPHALRRALSAALGISEAKVRVVSAGGGGAARPGSWAPVRREEILVAALARLLAPRAVSWTESPEEHALAAPRLAGAAAEVTIAARRDGRLLALRADAAIEAGAGPAAPDLSPLRGAALFAGPYAFLAAELRLRGAFADSPPTDLLAVRGGAFFACALERAIDEVAAALELEPAEVRRANLYREEECASATGVRIEPPRVREALDRLLERSGAAALRSERRVRRERGEAVGLGVALAVEACARGRASGPSPPRAAEEWSAATVRVLETGAVEVATGMAPRGPGLERALARIAAGALGVAESAVSVRFGDTGAGPPDAGASPGRSLPAGGSAVERAARAAEARLRAIAASILRVPEEYVQRWGGDFAAGDRSVSYEEVCRRAYRGSDFPSGPGIEATAYYDPEGPAVACGAHLSLVSLDPETGRARVERHVAVHDAGVLRSRETAEADLEEGILRGIEAALEGAGGPSGSEKPELRVAFLESRSPGNPIGARGIGECAYGGALAATANAVADALRGLGARSVDPPASPERLWRAIAEARP